MRRFEVISDSAGVGLVMGWFGEHPVLGPLFAIGGILLISWLSLVIVQRYLLRLVHLMAQRVTSRWGVELLSDELIRRVSWFVPLMIIHRTLAFVPNLAPDLLTLLQSLAFSTMLLLAVRAFSALLNTVHEIYNRHPVSKDRPIKGILQVINIIAHLVTVIFIIAALMSKSPWVLFSGLGALTAVFMLVFRDTLLSLVAGIQLTTNDLIRVGDWIEMPQFNADGDVIDIALNSVRVQNWDRTITVIPTHKFLEHSFKNWRGMREAGGRRIKRSVYIDMRAVRFLTSEEIEHFGRYELLRDYIAQKRAALEEHNRSRADDPDLIANERKLTNIGTFRAYVINYLRQHPGVHQGMTLMVRQMQPTAEGLPLEIYTFSNDTTWAIYEGVQADIFDHILAILPEFGLRVFQNPSGHDLQGIVEERVALQPA